MTSDSAPPPARTSGPARPLWLAGAGLLVVLAAVGGRAWLNRMSAEPPPAVPPQVPPDPEWVRLEADVRKRVEALRQSPPVLDDTQAHPVALVPGNPRQDQSKFQTAEDHRVYDLRRWKQTAPGDGPHAAGVVMTRTLTLAKTAPADRIDFLGRTTGAELVMRCDAPKPDLAKVYAAAGKVDVRGTPMTEHRLSVDVADVPVGAPFELRTRTTYWNSLQKPEEQWFGTVAGTESKLLSILLLFPEGRPFLGGGLRTGPAEGDLEPYTGTQYVFTGPGKSWVYWQVPGPKAGNVYRVDWKW